MINEHVTPDEIRRFRTGNLPVGECRRVGNHIASCADCSRLAESDPAARRTVEALAQAFSAFDDDHPDIDTITAFVDGQLPAEERAQFQQHLAECERCREDVDDLRTVAGAVKADRWSQRPRQVSRRAAFLFAAAAAAAVAILFFFLSPGREPRAIQAIHRPRVPSPNPSPAWPPSVRTAIESGRLDPPALVLDLQPPPESVRGEENGHGPAVRLSSPVDEVVEAARPTFRWEPLDRARFVVVIAEHGQQIARSPELHASEWQPDHDLIRGHVYEWQLEVVRDGGKTTIPAPPAPPVRFAVLADREASEILAARLAAPGDHLLLGVLAAQAGLRREAEAELRIAAQSPATAEPANRLLASVNRWPHSATRRP